MISPVVMNVLVLVLAVLWGVTPNQGLSSSPRWSQRPHIPARLSTRKLGTGHGDLYSGADYPPPRTFGPDYLIWQEEFDDLNLQTWEHMVTAWRGGNKEFQYYRNDRRNSVGFTIWMKPVENFYGGWPSSGEIDLVEARGNRRLFTSKGTNMGVERMSSTLHYGPNASYNIWRPTHWELFVRDGILHLQPTLTADEFGEDFMYNGTLSFPGCNHKPCESVAGQDIALPFLSARIRTQRSFGFRYGRVEVRAKLPRGDWLWPAIWMKPVENFYGGWPSSGEIDLVEARGNRRLFTSKGTNMGVERMSSTLHYGPNASYNIWRPTHWELSLEGSGSDFASDYHLFGMEWTRNSITFTLDNEVTGSISPPSGGFWKIGGFDKDPGGKNIWENGEYLAPFDRDHPLRDMWESRSKWLTTWLEDETALKVDYIRVFSLPSPLL
ncbi:hypothetical protein B566_EDAN015168 [Ephemera danica]|nr:hypothetical protein B566_EDAN015168 [Ephemera danica]